MLISAISSGISVEEYDTMDILEIAYTIEGNKERMYNELYYQRYMTWIQMKPHIKENTLKTPQELFELPIDKKPEVTTRADVEKMQEMWKESDSKKWDKIKKVF